jgi:transcriptional regulator with XRE-family HTH domain
MPTMDNENFTVLENKAIGRNISMYRKIRNMKASEVADRLGMKEASYTRYERGEASITVDLIQQVAEILKVDPITMLSVSPSNFIENCSHFAMNDYHNHSNEQHTQLMVKLVENIGMLNDRLLNFFDTKGK